LIRLNYAEPFSNFATWDCKGWSCQAGMVGAVKQLAHTLSTQHYTIIPATVIEVRKGAVLLLKM
jgi:hypothetical protein